jgi:hypothetical protein
MAAIPFGNGYLNTERPIYTYYDPSTGSLRSMVFSGSQSDWNVLLAQVKNGQYDPNVVNTHFAYAPNALGGRSNVNLSGQIQRAADKLIQQYPQMTWEDAQRYANQWVNDRIAAGWDANEIEDLAKGMLRDDKNLGEEMFKGIQDMVVRDELSARKAGDTGESLGVGGAGGADPRLSIQDELRKFAGEMMQTVGPDSPQAKRIAELAAAAGNKYATSSGMGPGGLTGRGVASTAARAHTDLQTQREGLGLQALSAAGNQQLSVDQLNTQLQQQNQQAGVLNASGIGGLIGSGLGLVGGIVGSAYSNGAMAPAIPGLMQAGGQAGQAAGGLLQNMSSPQIQYGGQQQAPRSTFSGRKWGTS